jgi:hypothetical protein
MTAGEMRLDRAELRSVDREAALRTDKLKPTLQKAGCASSHVSTSVYKV